MEYTLAPTCIKVVPQPDFCLPVTFDNGETRLYDVKPHFNHPAYGELRQIGYFKTVKPAGLSVEWLNGQDICPDELYYNSKLLN
jgi:hypothetical protein